MTNLTRLDTTLVATTVASSVTGIEGANATLEKVAPRLTKAERAALLKPSKAFPDAARAMVTMASEDAAALAAACNFDGPAVLEDLDNAEALIPLIARLQAMLRTAQDARLQWLGEAYAATLPLYRVATVRAADDAALESVMRPLHDVFAAPPAKAEPDPADGEADATE